MAEVLRPLDLPRNAPTVPKASILLVDDNPANLLSLRAILEDLGQNLVEARSGEEAIERVKANEFAVILLDVLMPGISGFETAKSIRDHHRSQHTPIIFLTAGDIDRSQMEEGYALGAVDFLVKPILPVAIQAKVRGFVQLFQDKQRTKHEADQLRLLVEGAKDYAIFRLDPQGNVASWNPGAERIKQYRADEIIGQHFSRFYPQDAIDRGWPTHELKVAKAEGRFEDEGWRIRKDGTQFWANVVITALYDETGNFRGFSKITRDLTERKKSEENARRLVEEATARRVAEENARFIQEQRERLHVTLASIGDAVISTDAKGRVDFLNPVAQELVGWKTEEAANRDLSDVFQIVNEETRQPVENPAVRALREGKIVGLANHTVLISKGGIERPIDDSAAPIRDAEGKVVGSVLVFRDISERKRFEAALNERLRLQTLSAAVGAALAQADELRPMLQHCAEALVEHLHGAFARIWTLNPQEDTLELQASAGLYTHLDGSHSRVPVGKYKIGLIAQERKPHLTNTVGVDPRVSDQRWAQREGMVAFAGYPLLVDDRLVGVMAMFARQPLSDATVEAMASVANGIAVGVERKVAEEERRQQQEWFRVTLASIGDAMIATDTHGCVTFLNDVAQELTGWTQEEAEGQPLEPVFTILNEQTRQRVQNPVEKVLRDGVIVGLGNHTVLIAKGGTERPIDDSAAPIRDSSGRMIGVVLIFRDVTEQRRAEREVRASDARKTAILETALDCIITMDHEGNVVEFNPAAEKTFCYRRAEVMGKELASLIIPPAFREQHRKGMAHYLATSEGPVLGKRLELPALRADGTEFPAELAITRIPTDGPPLFTAYLRDITEQKRAEQRRNVRLGVTHALSEASGVDDGASRVLGAVCENLGWDVGFVWTVNDKGDRLVCQASWHRPDVTVTEFETASRSRTFAKGEGLPGRAWASGKPAWIHDVLHESSFLRVSSAANDGLRSAFICPVVVGDRTLGVIEFFTKHIREADADVLETMGTVAGNIGQFLERKFAEEQVRQSERELADFFENATVGLHWVGPDGTILRANRAELDMLGYSREEYVGRPIADFHADEGTICDILKRLQAGEKLDEYPARLKCKDGSIRDVLIDSSVMFRDGQFIHTRCFTRDVTDRRRAEEQVRFQARMLDTVGQAAIVTDPDGTIIYWNRFAETLYGWASAEALGRNIIDVVVAPEAATQATEIMRRLRAGENWSGEFPVRRRDGTTFPAFVTDSPVLDDRGNLKAIIGVSVDMTDRKRLERSLRFMADASATLTTVVDYQSTLQKVAGLAVPHFSDWCAVDMAEPDGTLRRLAVAHVDTAKVRLAQELEERYPADPDVPHGAYHVLRTGKSEMMPEIPDALLVETARDEDHLRIVRKLGLKSFMCVPLQARGKTLGVVTFVTAESGREYTQADLAFAEELASRSAIAIENSRLYAELRDGDRRKDEFLATLAHELRNPLAPIRNSLQILKMPRVDAATIERSREMMERQVHHLVRLVDDLLDVSRVMRGKIELRREQFELATVVARAVETVQPLVDAQGHDLNVRLPKESLLLDADPVRLAQVVGNLLTNAAKYTEANGRIWLTAEREGDEAVLKVRDNGIGISPNMLPRIFDLFVQVDHASTKAQGGLGIGLTLVKNLVEMHNGTVEARSAGLGRGTEFVIRLPLSTQGLEQVHDRETGQRQQMPPVISGYRLLIVDDNHDAANSLAMLLKLQGHEVRVAHNGPAALEMTKDFAPDVVFLDIGMPGMDGYEVARRLRQQPGLEKVVLAALTGWGQKEDRRRTEEAGFDHHLVKPPEPKAVEGVLADLKRSKKE